MTKRTPANATVDFVAKEIGGGEAYWKVKVWSPFPPFAQRLYTIRAFSDSLAAEEGLRRFSVELDTPV